MREEKKIKNIKDIQNLFIKNEVNPPLVRDNENNIYILEVDEFVGEDGKVFEFFGLWDTDDWQKEQPSGNWVIDTRLPKGVRDDLESSSLGFRPNELIFTGKYYKSR